MNRMLPIDEITEWLEADGLGGFASGTSSGLRTRRYHGLLSIATTPPTGRMVLVNGFDAWIEEPAPPGTGKRETNASGGREFLTRQRYSPGIVAPEQAAAIEAFRTDPWPTWTYSLRDGTELEQEIFVTRGSPIVAIRWRVRGAVGDGVTLSVRPFLSGRDLHALHHENPAFRFAHLGSGPELSWAPYGGVPGVAARSNGEYRADPAWYRGFLYSEERARGLDFEEDLAAPGVFRWELSQGPAILILSLPGTLPTGTAAATYDHLSRSERGRRARLGSELARAGDAYLVRRGSGKTVIAGYPWFTDWGRDTFIALRGLAIATGRLAEARSSLLGWAGLVSEGMLPNRFVDQGDAPEFNSVDASLWYVIAVHHYFQAMEARGRKVPASDRYAFLEAIAAIVSGYRRGTRHGIHLDDDGLLAAGAPGLQLTWMDAKVGDWVVTPRIGKPVEIQALWLNVLRIADELIGSQNGTLQKGLAAFNRRFWNPTSGYLHDVVDVDHVPGTVDESLRPNQLFAIGGLPFPVLDRKLSRSVVEVVAAELWTPLGLRTLPLKDSRYVGRYEGGVRSRDGSYHQGTVWPWLMGPFVEAWVRVHGGGDQARREAREKFFTPLLAHLSSAGVGHISEIADADPPHTPRGCPFQAWSVGEALRLDLDVLAPGSATAEPSARLVGTGAR